MLDLGINTDRTAALFRLGGNEVDDLVERRHAELAVELRIARAQLGQAFARAQGFEFGEGEVLGEPAGDRLAVDGLGRLARGEFRVFGDVGRARDLVFVAGDESAVAGHDQVGLDEIGAVLDRLAVRGERMFRTQRACAAVAEDEDFFGQRFRGRRGVGGGNGHAGEGDKSEESKA